METKRNRSPFTFKKKLFLGFSLGVVTAFLYLNVVLIAEPVSEHLNLPHVEAVADTQSSKTAPRAPIDSLKTGLPSLPDVLPEIEEVVTLPRFEIGPF